MCSPVACRASACRASATAGEAQGVSGGGRPGLSRSSRTMRARSGPSGDSVLWRTASLGDRGEHAGYAGSPCGAGPVPVAPAVAPDDTCGRGAVGVWTCGVDDLGVCWSSWVRARVGFPVTLQRLGFQVGPIETAGSYTLQRQAACGECERRTFTSEEETFNFADEASDKSRGRADGGCLGATCRGRAL